LNRNFNVIVIFRLLARSDVIENTPEYIQFVNESKISTHKHPKYRTLTGKYIRLKVCMGKEEDRLRFSPDNKKKLSKLLIETVRFISSERCKWNSSILLSYIIQ